MLDKKKILKYLSDNKAYFKTKYFVDQIALVGSFSRGDFNESSDIDLIVFFNEEANKNRFFRLYVGLQDELMKHFKKNVDIIANGKVLPAFKEVIEKEAVYV
jgi:predicted nucleotidyltransferase